MEMVIFTPRPLYPRWMWPQHPLNRVAGIRRLPETLQRKEKSQFLGRLADRLNSGNCLLPFKFRIFCPLVWRQLLECLVILRPEDGGNTLLRNISKFPTDYTVSRPQKAERYWGRLCNGDAPDLYSGGVWFEFRPGHRLSWLRLSVVLLGPYRQIWGQ
jgi:hypothetical protein